MSKFANKRRIKDPSGCWDYVQLIGAKVQIKSLPVSNQFKCFSSGSSIGTIDNIYFRISLDGKTITVIELLEYPDQIFTWRDLQIIEVNNVSTEKAICGTVICGEVLCNTPPGAVSEISGGIAVVDNDENTVITNRYIRIRGAKIEDPTNDEDQITDININVSGGTF